MKKNASLKRMRQEEEQKPNSVSKPFITYLPQDIIIAILTLLPVKTLIRFTCVCKSWQCLISNTNFINTHLSKYNKQHTNQRVMLTYFGASDVSLPSYFVKSFSLDMNAAISSGAVLLDYPARDSKHEVSIRGSCNGLVCLVIDDVEVFLWNPCTKTSKALPDSGHQFQQDVLTCYDGFGHDRINDDYKVVLVVCSVDSMGYMGKKVVHVYSLKANLWREIGEFPLQGCNGIFDRGAKYVDGVLHWALPKHLGEGKSSMVIVSFDLENENFGEIKLPWDGDWNVSFMSLGVFEGCLSVFSHVNKPDDKICVDIWIMKDNGARDTWTKLSTTQYETKKMCSPYSYCIPLCIFKTGEILLERGFRLFLYNPKNGKFRNLDVENLSRSLTHLQATTYVESLVSPNIYDEVTAAQH